MKVWSNLKQPPPSLHVGVITELFFRYGIYHLSHTGVALHVRSPWWAICTQSAVSR